MVRDQRDALAAAWQLAYIWDLEGCNCSIPAVAKLHSKYRNSGLGLLNVTLESLVASKNGEGQKKNRGNINTALCFLTQIHVAITLQRQVLASAITTHLKEGVTTV